jgi:hypothetical protein
MSVDGKLHKYEKSFFFLGSKKALTSSQQEKSEA